jgi:hypothetical protein
MMKRRRKMKDDENFRDAEEHEQPPEDELPPDDEDDDEPEDIDATPVEEPPKMPTDEDRKLYANMLLDKLEEINNKDQEDWFQALLSVELDKHRGDFKKAFAQASECYEQHPEPPKHEEEESTPAEEASPISA